MHILIKLAFGEEFCKDRSTRPGSSLKSGVNRTSFWPLLKVKVKPSSDFFVNCFLAGGGSVGLRDIILRVFVAFRKKRSKVNEGQKAPLQKSEFELAFACNIWSFKRFLIPGCSN
jgi:hypothetical protein